MTTLKPILCDPKPCLRLSPSRMQQQAQHPAVGRHMLMAEPHNQMDMVSWVSPKGINQEKRRCYFQVSEEVFLTKRKEDEKLGSTDSSRDKIKVRAFYFLLTWDFELLHSLSSWLWRWRSAITFVPADAGMFKAYTIRLCSSAKCSSACAVAQGKKKKDRNKHIKKSPKIN